MKTLLLLAALPLCAAETNLTAAACRPFLPGDAQLSSWTTVFQAVDAADRAADAAWRACTTRAAFDARRREQKARMIAALGGFPVRTPLNARTLAVIPRAGYRIEKVLLESLPGVYVTGLLYLPAAPGPHPAVVITCGHSNNGKNAAGYQRACVLAAQAGFAAFIYDPYEQGDRRQPPAPGVKAIGNCDGHNAIGARAMLLGRSMAQLRIWDGMRAIDYVQSRSEVDAARIGYMGQSGGGTMTSLMMATDDRIRAAAPSCYLTNFRELCRHCGPQDAEQNIFGQLAFGLNHASYVFLQDIPVCIVCKYSDFFPYYGTCATYDLVREVAGFLGTRDRYFLLAEPGPHGWIEATRTGSVQWMRHWLRGESILPDTARLRLLDYGFDLAKVDCGLPENEASVPPTGQVCDLPGFRSIYDVLRDDLAKALAARRPRTAAETSALVGRLAKIRNVSDAHALEQPMGEETLPDGTRVRRWAHVYPDGLALPLVLFTPAHAQGAARLIVSPAGRGAAAPRIAAALAEGCPVAVADLTAGGEIGAKKHPFYRVSRRYPAENVAQMLYLLGESLVGRRATDLLVLAAALTRITGAPPELEAEGNYAIPAAHARAFDPAAFASVAVRTPPPSWAEAVRGTDDQPFENNVNGALLHYDWPDLLAR